MFGQEIQVYPAPEVIRAQNELAQVRAERAAIRAQINALTQAPTVPTATGFESSAKVVATKAAEEAAAAKIRVPVPWYKQPRTWLFAGVGLTALALLARR